MARQRSWKLHPTLLTTPLYTFCSPSMARAIAFVMAEMPSIRLVLFSRSGLANIRLSLRSTVARQLAFQRSTGWAPWCSLPRAGACG